MKISLVIVTGLLAVTALPSGAFAQYYDSTGYYQPRVVQPPPPPFSRDGYVAGGTIGGGAVGQYYGGSYGGVVGGGIGGYAGGQAYDVQGATRYYSAPYMGTQSTTPYMIRPRR